MGYLPTIPGPELPERNSRKRLLILMKDGTTLAQAAAIQAALTERLGIEAVVISGAVQAVVVEADG